MGILVIIALTGAGCANSVENTTKNQPESQVDYFAKKVECSKMFDSESQKIKDDQSYDTDVVVDKICYSSKYDTCVIKYVGTPTVPSVRKNIAEMTFFVDVLTQDLLKREKLSVNEQGEEVYLINKPPSQRGPLDRDGNAQDYRYAVANAEAEICVE